MKKYIKKYYLLSDKNVACVEWSEGEGSFKQAREIYFGRFTREISEVQYRRLLKQGYEDIGELW